MELVWRMEVTAKDNAMPVRELILVNAERGGISLHFNQIDTAWTSSGVDNSRQTIEAAVNPSEENMPALAGATWYVATTGNDANSCSVPASPCATINGAIAKAASGDTINVRVWNLHRHKY